MYKLPINIIAKLKLLTLLLFSSSFVCAQISPSWQYSLGSDYELTNNKTAVFHFDESLKLLRALELSTGKAIWEQSLNASNLIADEQHLYFLAENTRVKARKVNDGSLSWSSKATLPESSRNRNLSFKLLDDILLVKRFRGARHDYKSPTFIALDKATGLNLWSWELAEDLPPSNFITQIDKTIIFSSHSWVSNDKVSNDKTTYLYGVNSQTGIEEWSLGIVQAWAVKHNNERLILSNHEVDAYGWTEVNANTGERTDISMQSIIEEHGVLDTSSYWVGDDYLWLFIDKGFAKLNLETKEFEEWLELPTGTRLQYGFEGIFPFDAEPVIYFNFPPFLLVDDNDDNPILNLSALDKDYALHSLNLNTGERKRYLDAFRKEIVGNDWYQSYQPRVSSTFYPAWVYPVGDFVFWVDDYGYSMVFDRHTGDLLINQKVSLHYHNQVLVGNTALLWGSDHDEDQLFVFNLLNP